MRRGLRGGSEEINKCRVEDRGAAGKTSLCGNSLTDSLHPPVSAPHPRMLLSPSTPPLHLPPPTIRQLLSPRLVFSPLLAPSLTLPFPLSDCWVIQMVLLRAVNGVRPDWGKEGELGEGEEEGGAWENQTIM